MKALPLSITHPQIAAEWHSTLNADLTPDKVVAGSGKKVWWRCLKGPDHEWEAVIAKRTTIGRGCPCCAGQKISVTNSLASLFPEIAADWHSIKNRDLTPEMVLAGSH